MSSTMSTQRPRSELAATARLALPMLGMAGATAGLAAAAAAGAGGRLRARARAAELGSAGAGPAGDRAGGGVLRAGPAARPRSGGAMTGLIAAGRWATGRAGR